MSCICSVDKDGSCLPAGSYWNQLKKALFIFDALSLPPTSINPVLFPDYISFQFNIWINTHFHPNYTAGTSKVLVSKWVSRSFLTNTQLPKVYFFHLVSISDHIVGSQGKTRKLSKTIEQYNCKTMQKKKPSLTDAFFLLNVVKFISAITERVKELHVGLQKSVTLNSKSWNKMRN